MRLKRKYAALQQEENDRYAKIKKLDEDSMANKKALQKAQDKAKNEFKRRLPN